MIIGQRLQAAWKAGGFESWQKLAEASGVPHPTISRLRRRKVDKANPDTVARLAAALRVPADWLTGDRESLPHVPKHGLLEDKGPGDPETVTAGRVRLSWLLHRADQALRRDLRAWYGTDAEAAYDSWGHGVMLAVEELASPMWRLTALVADHPGVYVMDEEKRLREERGTNKKRKGALLDNEATTAWLNQVLEPWFRGRAHLNAFVLRNLLLVIIDNPIRKATQGGSVIWDADMIRGLEEYNKTYEKHETKPEWTNL